MQRGRTRKCQVPVRTRRRQSDAKWRASVASCYETLKFIIPNGKTLPKRKASKSLILQETEKHIGSLERALSRLLNIEAQEEGQGVLWNKGDNWSPATLEDFQNDFTKQQGVIFQQSPQGRRCYNMLHDIQEEILNLSADNHNIAFVPLNPGDDDKNTRDAATCTTRRQRISKARCRYETERATQRILSAYNTGDFVDAVIPFPNNTSTDDCSDQAQAVPTTPVTTHTLTNSASTASVSSNAVVGTTVRLQKLGGFFINADHGFHARASRRASDGMPFSSLSGFDRVVVKRQHESEQLQSLQEVPVSMTPRKVYGLAHHDVMMPQECEVTDVGHSAAPQLTAPVAKLTSHFLGKREDSEHSVPTLSNVCKKLDFTVPPPELLFESDGSIHVTTSPSPVLSSVVTATSTGLTPLKAATCTLGMTPLKSATTTLNEDVHTFTPLKTSSEPYMSDTALFSPNSAWALGNAMDARVPQAGLSDLETLTDMEDDHNLLCMESFDLDDVTESSSHDKTPQKPPNLEDTSKHVCKRRSGCKKKSRSERKHGHAANRPRPRCRKRLEGLYEKHTEGNDKTSGVPFTTKLCDGSSTEWSDFDGYLLYYQQVAPGLKQQLGTSHDANSLAAIVSGMWSRLPSDDRNTMVTLAALENQDSNSSASGSLSQDLEELNVTPIDAKEGGY
ncbi:uncharacterized protein [Littorina saxatilis]|uniref:BHLH domain-containing protein n=1 Tax=Littorina saxatilis TaxID=31220 RepID=A0AAN9G9G2_9CAEN